MTRGRSGIDLSDRGSDSYRLAWLYEDLGQRPAGRAWDLDVDLVGGDLPDRLVGLDRVAGLPAPFDDGPLRNGDTQMRHQHLHRRFSTRGAHAAPPACRRAVAGR